MGTLVRRGDGRGLVVRTGAYQRSARSLFGSASVKGRPPSSRASRHSSSWPPSRRCWRSIFLINVALGRSVLQSALFALAIAVGLTPQLLPAIVTVSLATGARRLAARRVIVKRLVCIEDLGNIDVLFTDKTGTLTEGRISFTKPLDSLGTLDVRVRELGLACSDRAGNELDRALWAGNGNPKENGDGWPVLGVVPFDHERQLASALVEMPDGRRPDHR